MALPTITRISRTSSATDPYYQGHTTTAANYDRSVISTSGTGIHIYAVDAGTTDRYSYEELFTALDNHADIAATITTGDIDAGDPSRTIVVSATVSNHTCLILLRSGTLFHEIPGTTYVDWGTETFFPIIGAPAQVNTAGTTLNYGASNLGPTGASGDRTAWTGRHEITLGQVVMESPSRLFQLAQYPDSNASVNTGTQGGIRTVDGGHPDKVVSGRLPGAAKAAIGYFTGASGQSCLITDNRLRYEFSVPNAPRQDFDICGDGVYDVSFLCWNTGSGGSRGFIHTTATNPNNNIRMNTFEDLVVGSETRHRKAAGSELQSDIPALVEHRYLGFQMRANTPIENIHKTQNDTGGQTVAALTGNRANAAATRQRLVLHAFRPNLFQYWQQQFSGSDVTDLLWLDPSFRLTTTNTPINIAESTGSTRSKDMILLRSVGVDNQDAAGNPKASLGHVFGNQKSANLRAHRSTWLSSILPPVRTHANDGVWSVRPTDTQGAGLDRVVGRGAHYLVDGVLHEDTQGNQASEYTRYTNYSTGNSNAGDNESWILHRGGLHRYSQNVALRDADWNFNSNGATGLTHTVQHDDISGFDDNIVNMFKYSGGEPDLDIRVSQAYAVGTTTYEFTTAATGQPAFTALLAECMVGADLRSSRFPANTTISSATVLSNGNLQIVSSAANTTAFTANNDVSVGFSGYTWDLQSDGDLVFTMTGTNSVRLTYTAFAALIQGALENIIERKFATMGTETTNYTNSNDIRYGSTSTLLNTLIERMTAATQSYIAVGPAANVIMVDRLEFSLASGNSLTLVPDSSNAFLDFGTSLDLPDNVTPTGGYRDSNGSPSIIGITFPSGVTASDVTCSVVYQNGTTWTVGENPTIQTSGGRSYIEVSPANSFPSGNTTGNWYLAITGGPIQDFRAQYNRNASQDITLVSSLTYPTATISESQIGGVRFVGIDINTNANSVTETLNADPNPSSATYINSVDRLALDFYEVSSNGYDDQENNNRIRKDVADARDSVAYADYVARYGAQNIIGNDTVNLDQNNFRIRITRTSRAQFVLIDAAVPSAGSTDPNRYKVKVLANQQGFFGVPTFSLPAVEGAVEGITDAQTTTLQASIEEAAFL